MNNEKNVILLTGADSDIGGEIIRQISAEGMTILAHYFLNEDKVNRLAKTVSAKIVPIKADFSKEEEVKSLISFVLEKYICPNKIVFLAARRMKNIRFKDINWQDFQSDIDIQLRSSVLISKAFAPMMAKERKGKIVFVLSSVTLGVPPKTLSNYVTVKYAMLGLMKSLAAEYAEKQVCVNAVSPSMAETDFLKEIPEKIVELSAQAHPMKRNATPSDIAPAVSFLLSDQADYITGVNIPVTGGLEF